MAGPGPPPPPGPLPPPNPPLPPPPDFPPAPPQAPGPPYPIAQTVISQYQNSPVLMRLIDNLVEYFDPTVRLNDFYNLIWNIDSAQGWGLDVWGRILGVGRLLHVPIPGDYLGWTEAGDAFTFGEGIWYGGAAPLTENFYLSDGVYRRVLLAKAFANICDGSIPAINQILCDLFPDYGNCYVIDNLNMTMTYRFTDELSAPDSTLAQQSGVLPKPAGVAASFDIG